MAAVGRPVGEAKTRRKKGQKTGRAMTEGSRGAYKREEAEERRGLLGKTVAQGYCPALIVGPFRFAQLATLMLRGFIGTLRSV